MITAVCGQKLCGPILRAVLPMKYELMCVAMGIIKLLMVIGSLKGLGRDLDSVFGVLYTMGDIFIEQPQLS